MTIEEQYALSHRYSNTARIVLPLPSGRFAVFDNARRLHSIVDEAELWRAVMNCPLAAGYEPKPIEIDLSKIQL